MIGSSLYFVALLAVAEIEITEKPPVILTEDTEIPLKNNTEKTDETSIPTSNTINTLTPKPTSVEQTHIPITIANAIDAEMLKYKHTTGTYTPKTFDLYINDVKVEPGQTYTLEEADKPFTVKFDYCFKVLWTVREGTKSFVYKMKENCTHASLTFSWLDEWKVLIDNAIPIKKEIEA